MTGGEVTDQPPAQTQPTTGIFRVKWRRRTLPTAASPSSTSLTLLLGFGAVAVESAIFPRIVVGLVTNFCKASLS